VLLPKEGVSAEDAMLEEAPNPPPNAGVVLALLADPVAYPKGVEVSVVVYEEEPTSKDVLDDDEAPNPGGWALTVLDDPNPALNGEASAAVDGGIPPLLPK